MSFFPEIDVSADHARAIARALHTVAASDGVHPREVALIGALFAELHEAPTTITPEELATALPFADLRLLTMKLAYLVAHNEGGVTDPERALLDRFATALDLTGADRIALEEQVLGELIALVPRS